MGGNERGLWEQTDLDFDILNVADHRCAGRVERNAVGLELAEFEHLLVYRVVEVGGHGGRWN